MTKPKLKLGFTDYYPTMDEFFLDTLSVTFDIERDDENPEYLIFADETFGTRNLSYDISKVRKIFFTGENRRPQNYQAHFAISFDFVAHDQFYRLPLYILDNFNGMKIGCESLYDVNKRKFTSDDWHNRKKFCGFVSGNGGSQSRNRMFELLSHYKKVDSAGPLFNNIGHIIPRGHEAQLHKMHFLKDYRFNLCYENSSYPGYVTEKLPHARIAGTLPIYWGSPVVDMDFNTDAFINRHDYESDGDMIGHIIAIDNNVDLWLEKMNASFINPKNKYIDLNRFRRWFRNYVYKGE
jgi:hypothetical protein